MGLLGRATFGFLGLFFMAGAIVMMFIAFLGGSTSRHPESLIYFLEADTSNIPGAPATSRWTWWNVCAVGPDGKNQCGSSHPDYPFDPPSHRTFNTTVNVPPEFVGSRHYFLTSRFMFPFMIIALFFAVCSWFVSLISAMCLRAGAFTSAILAWIALIFQTIVVCLMTAVYVQGRNAFSRNGQSASLGSIMFGLMWASLPCLFLASLFYCLGGIIKTKRESGYSGREQRRRGFFTSNRSASMREHSEP